MASYLHLLKADSAPLAPAVIASSLREADARITVVVLDGSAAPALPGGVPVRRLAPGDLDHAGLLDLIFSHDHVVTW
jgi:hypothetical protein